MCPFHLGTCRRFRHHVLGTQRERRVFFHISPAHPPDCGKLGIQSLFSTARLARNCKSRLSRSKDRAEFGQHPPYPIKGVRAALLVEDALTNLSSPRRSAGLVRQIGLAVALASGTALLAVPGFTDAAYAQKKKKDEKEAPKAAYTEAFVKAYQPIETALKAPTPDVAALKPRSVGLPRLGLDP